MRIFGLHLAQRHHLDTISILVLCSLGNDSTIGTDIQEESSSSLVTVVYKVTEKAMAPHSSTLAWRISWTEEAGGLQSMGSLGVEQN